MKEEGAGRRRGSGADEQTGGGASERVQREGMICMGKIETKTSRL